MGDEKREQRKIEIGPSEWCVETGIGGDSGHQIKLISKNPPLSPPLSLTMKMKKKPFNIQLIYCRIIFLLSFLLTDLVLIQIVFIVC